MQVNGPVVTITDDGQAITREVACVEREARMPETLGLSLAAGKPRLQAMHEVVVEWQMHPSLRQPRPCPHCGHVRRSQGTHHTVFRTVFGGLSVASPRLYQCRCQGTATTRVRPLATLLPERTTPDLRSLETNWAAFMSYGLTATLLQAVLPMDEPLEALTLRHHVRTRAERRENALGEEPWSCIDRCPAEWAA